MWKKNSGGELNYNNQFLHQQNHCIQDQRWACERQKVCACESQKNEIGKIRYAFFSIALRCYKLHM